MGITVSSGFHASRQVPASHVREYRNRTIQKREIDKLASSSTSTCDHCRQNSLHGVHSSHDVCYGHAELHGLSVRFTCDRHETAFGLDGEVVAWLFSSRAGPAVARDRTVDELRIKAGEGFIPQTKPIQSSLAKVFDEHIGLLGKFAHKTLSVRMSQIYRHRSLGPIAAHEIS